MKGAATTLTMVALALSGCGGTGVLFGLGMFHRAATRLDRLPAIIVSFDPFLSEGPARFLGVVGDDRYWAVRYSDQFCLVSLPLAPRHRIGPGESCGLLASLHRAPNVSFQSTDHGVQVLGVVRDGYDRVTVEGIRKPVPVRGNVFITPSPFRHPHLTASGPHVPDERL
jgi:hypothetical protein